MTIYYPHDGVVPVSSHITNATEVLIYTDADFNIVGTNVARKSLFNIVPGTPNGFVIPVPVAGDVVGVINIQIASPAILQLFINQTGADPELRFILSANAPNVIRFFVNLETVQGMTFDLLFADVGAVYSFVASIGAGRYYQKTKRSTS